MALREQTELRAHFLQEAVHLLAISSPAAAAFLGSSRDHFIQDAGLEITPKEHDAHRREICGACGNVLVPGWSCKVYSRPLSEGSGRSRKTTKMPAKSPTRTAYMCLRCHRETLQALQPKPRRQLKKSSIRIEPQPAVEEVKKSKKATDGPLNKTMNASSKQRQKARKGGLQAMLEKKKAQSSSLGGLDFMDFAM